MSGPEPIIEVEAVHKSFGPQQVLRGLSLRFLRGQTTVVLGPSGCGKSVLLKHIAVLLRPDRGRVLFRGSRIDNLPEHSLAQVRKHIGFLFQLSALFDSMTIEENLEFPLVEHTRLRPAERRRQVIEALEMVDLHGVEHKRPAELSGGQQKRAALARAVMLRPQVILYDEPTTGLDPTRADGINNLILKLQHELNVTSVVVTHDLQSANRVADRMVMLHAGTVLAEGSPDEIRASADPHVRKFLAGVHDPDEEEEAGERSPHPPALPAVGGPRPRAD